MPTVDLRCPEDPRKLLMRLKHQGEKPHVVEGNLLELACDACKARERKKNSGVALVLHRFDLAGTLIESEIVLSAGR